MYLQGLVDLLRRAPDSLVERIRERGADVSFCNPGGEQTSVRLAELAGWPMICEPRPVHEVPVLDSELQPIAIAEPKVKSSRVLPVRELRIGRGIGGLERSDHLHVGLCIEGPVHYIAVLTCHDENRAVRRRCFSGDALG